MKTNIIRMVILTILFCCLPAKVTAQVLEGTITPSSTETVASLIEAENGNIKTVCPKFVHPNGIKRLTFSKMTFRGEFRSGKFVLKELWVADSVDEMNKLIAARDSKEKPEEVRVAEVAPPEDQISAEPAKDPGDIRVPAEKTPAPDAKKRVTVKDGVPQKFTDIHGNEHSIDGLATRLALDRTEFNQQKETITALTTQVKNLAEKLLKAEEAAKFEKAEADRLAKENGELKTQIQNLQKKIEDTQNLTKDKDKPKEGEKNPEDKAAGIAGGAGGNPPPPPPPPPKDDDKISFFTLFYWCLGIIIVVVLIVFGIRRARKVTPLDLEMLHKQNNIPHGRTWHKTNLPPRRNQA